ncbi:thioredoxin domain-containing protein [Catenulispora pinisilvae]|uniref:DsbA family protein n=1 Tax=Catenulispora pinisilvae TaxID=2705253 RepID=UPI0018927EBE|nr:thioredoxin domain-containing protein [Catenulispora pinisilvae]
MAKQDARDEKSARARVAAEREAQKRKSMRLRRISVLAAVVAVIGVSVGVGIAVSTASTKPKAYTPPADGSVVADKYANPANKATALAYGPATAPHTLTIFEDFRCPYCKALETGSASVYKAYVAKGTLRVLFHPVTLIDSNDNGSGSLQAGNAAVCAATAGKFIEYHDVLFANQPDETTDGYSATATLIALAKQVPGLDTPAFESCVTAGTYKGLVQQNWSDFNALSLKGTPTLMLDGKTLTLPDNLWKASKDGSSLAGSDPAVLRQVLQAAGLPAS